MSRLISAGRRKHSLRNWFRWLAPVATLVLLAAGSSTCHALILKGEGNSPLDDPGWPVGAAAVFNTHARVGWWEGPPFGGGQWHAECRGDAAALNDVLVNFAKIDTPKKLLIVHDGVGSGFWDKLDWVFVVWQSANFQRQAALPPRIRQPGVDYQQGPVPQIDMYVGGRIKWADVKVPEGIEVVDERLEAHGFAATDGTVLEGTVVDLANGEPLAARVRLEGIEPQPNTVTDQSGRWVLKNVPAGGFRVVVEAEGCVSRILGYGQSDGEPKWREFRGGLSRPGPVSGRVTDEDDRPLAGVLVRLDDMVVAAGGLYETPAGLQFETDQAGRFESFDVPIGKASVWVFKDGYCRPGLGLPVTTPALNLKLTMMQSAEVQVVVDFSQTVRPEGYYVEFAPEQGRRAGSWSGSGTIDASGAILFKNVPPGRYVIFGRPNPGSADEQTGPITVEVVGGETTKVVLKAK
jgi:hypothetical protein